MTKITDITESQLDSLREDEQGDAKLTALSEQNLKTGDHEIARLYEEELQKFSAPPVFGLPKVPPDKATQETIALSTAVTRFVDKHREKLTDVCTKFDYCAKMEMARGKWKDAIGVLKSLAEFVSFKALGAPLFSLGWYLMKKKLLDDYICQCGKAKAAQKS